MEPTRRRSARKTAARPVRYADGASDEDAPDSEEEASSPSVSEEQKGRPKHVQMVVAKRERAGEKDGGQAKRSRYIGVCWYKASQKWQVKIRVRGVRQHLGYFDDEVDGACAYDAEVEAQNLRRRRNFTGGTGAEQAVKRSARVARAFARADDPKLLATLEALEWKPTLDNVIALKNAMLAKRRRETGMTKRTYQRMRRVRGAAPPAP